MKTVVCHILKKLVSLYSPGLCAALCRESQDSESDEELGAMYAHADHGEKAV